MLWKALVACEPYTHMKLSLHVRGQNVFSLVTNCALVDNKAKLYCGWPLRKSEFCC